MHHNSIAWIFTDWQATTGHQQISDSFIVNLQEMFYIITVSQDMALCSTFFNFLFLHKNKKVKFFMK